MNFFDSFFLWKEAVISSVFLAAALSVTGIYVILRRVVFLPAALSQFSGFGVMVAFVAAQYFSTDFSSSPWFPLTVAFGLSLAGIFGLGNMNSGGSNSREAIIGIWYILASGGVIILSGIVPQESHHMNDILFGNALLVNPTMMNISIGVSITVLVIHSSLKNAFMFISFDEETAIAHGLPVRHLNVLLFISMAMTIAVSTKTIGALPTFTFAILPAYLAIKTFHTISRIMIFAIFTASGCAFSGYWISYILDFPTGATTTVCTGIVCGGLFLFFKCIRVFRTQYNY